MECEVTSPVTTRDTRVTVLDDPSVMSTEWNGRSGFRGAACYDKLHVIARLVKTIGKEGNWTALEDTPWERAGTMNACSV